MPSLVLVQALEFPNKKKSDGQIILKTEGRTKIVKFISRLY